MNIHTVLENKDLPPTLLMQMAGAEIEEAVTHLSDGGFGIVAGTGTGKTVAIGEICQKVLGTDLKVDVVTREHEATDKTWSCNVLVVTPGVALNWFKSGRLTANDLMILDEVHQTSEQLELAMGLAKRPDCTFVWMSATIDPTRYQEYLNARTVIRCEAFDPERKARVEVISTSPYQFLQDKLPEFTRQRRGVAVFVPTRSMAENLASDYNGKNGLHADYYHGGESAEKLRPYLTGDISRPFVVFMTIAGASSLNVVGLDTVVIIDEWYTEVIRPGGVRSLEQTPLGSNELLQMGGRVNGRAVNGQIYILSHRVIDFHELQPTAPQFKLGGELEQLALTCARVGVDARELDLIGDFDHEAYAHVIGRLMSRELIKTGNNGQPRLTDLGKRVENLPVRPAWGEMLVFAQDLGHSELLKMVIVCACIEQLYSLTRRDWSRWMYAIQGSDHLTAYSIIRTALADYGYVKTNGNGKEYALRGDYAKAKRGQKPSQASFRDWCERDGLVAKEIRNVLLAIRSVFRQLKMELPDPADFPAVTQGSMMHTMFVELLAGVQSLDYVRDGVNSEAGQVFAQQGGLSTNYSALGKIRYWTDKSNIQRASMEGTNIPLDVVRRYAKRVVQSVIGMSEDGQRVRVYTGLCFAGEYLWEQNVDELAPHEVPADVSARLPRFFAEWLANQATVGDSALAAVLKHNIAIRRRAASLNVRLGGSALFEEYHFSELAGFYLAALKGARCLDEVKDPEALKLPELDAELAAEVAKDAPDTITVNDRQLELEYDWRGVAAILGHGLITDGTWKKLPEMRLCLPDGRTVLFKAELTAGVLTSALSASMLVREVREYINLQQWQAWVDKSGNKPDVSLPGADPMTWRLPDITVAMYGKDALTEEPLVAYGTPSVDYGLSGELPLRVVWCRTRAEAERLHYSVRIQLDRIRERYEEAKLEKEIKEFEHELRALLRESREDLEPELVSRIDKLLTGSGFLFNRQGRLSGLKAVLGEAQHALSQSDDPADVTSEDLGALMARFNTKR